MCAEGYKHRPAAKTCTNAIVPADACNGGGQCTKNADCTQKPFGVCSSTGIPIGSQQGSAGGAGCLCNYGCETDSDCGADQFCLCASPIGVCLPATCKTDADCPDSLCSRGDVACEEQRLSCFGPTDKCKIDADCPQPVGSNAHICSVKEDGRFCAPLCYAGRPLMLDGSPRLARLASRTDWLRPDLAARPGA